MKNRQIIAFREVCGLFTKTVKFLNLAFKIERVRTKHKNLDQCLSEKLASFYTLHFIYETLAVSNTIRR